MKALIASLAAAAVTMIPLALLTGYVLVTDTGFDLDGKIDNAPIRAAGAILFLLGPAAFFVSVLYFPLLSWILARLRLDTFASFGCVAAALSGLATVLLALFSEEGGAIGRPSISIFLGTLLLVSLVLGSAVWRRLERWRSVA